MNTKHTLHPLKHLKDDIPASIVVFLVAMPLCLGIALASGAPLLSGLISGVIGGLIVGSLSGSALGVSGPAAGLAVIVFTAIESLGGFEIFLVAIVLAGAIQIIMGLAKAGTIAYFFPSSVIHGMLAGIGVIIFLKQIPHAFGYDSDPEGDFEFHQVDGHNTFESITDVFHHISLGVVIIASVSLFILILWGSQKFQKMKFTKLLQGPLVAVVTGIILNLIFRSFPSLSISQDHLVHVPVTNSTSEFFSNFTFPDWSALSQANVYGTAVVIAIVASLETLLCVEASDKQDTLKRVTPTNRELLAQGVGNIVAGCVGGLPVTQVIVRSSANQQSGGKTKASTIIHGFLLLVSVVTIPKLLNLIPLGVLAAILLVVGYKLAHPKLFKRMYQEGMGQFLPFLVTIVGIVLTDLLLGIGMGMVVAILIILRNNFSVPFTLQKESLEGVNKIKIILSEDVTFLNKASILKTLDQIPDGSVVEIDASPAKFIHFDVVEIIEDFVVAAKVRQIDVTVIDLHKERRSHPMRHFELATDKKETS